MTRMNVVPASETPAVVEKEDHREKFAEVLELVKKAMATQDAATYNGHGLSEDLDQFAENTAHAIAKVYGQGL